MSVQLFISQPLLTYSLNSPTISQLIQLTLPCKPVSLPPPAAVGPLFPFTADVPFKTRPIQLVSLSETITVLLAAVKSQASVKFMSPRLIGWFHCCWQLITGGTVPSTLEQFRKIINGENECWLVDWKEFGTKHMLLLLVLQEVLF